MTLSWHTKNAVKSAASYRRQFYGVFLSFSRLWYISLIFRTIHHLNNPRHVFISSKTVQNACKIVNLAASLWLFRSITLTILQPHFDYFALPNIQNDTPKSQERHSNPCFPPLKTWFPCVQRSARKYQSPAIIAIIYSLHFNTIQLQPFPPTTNFSSTDMSSNTRYAISCFQPTVRTVSTLCSWHLQLPLVGICIF